MNEASAPRQSGAARPALTRASDRAASRLLKVYKSVSGGSWHYEDPGRRRSSYLQTVCGRRQGRRHLQPARDVATVPDEDICASCRRSVATPPSTPSDT